MVCTLEAMRFPVLLSLSIISMAGCGRTGSPANSSLSGADASAPPAACASLSLMGVAELGPSGEDSLGPVVVERPGLLGVSWLTRLKAGTNDQQLRFATFGAGMKPASAAGAMVSEALPGAEVALAAGPQAWAALFMRGSTTGSLVPKLVLARFDGAGKAQGPALEITSQAMAQALAAQPQGGYGMIYTHPSKVGAINFRALDSKGKAGAARLVVVGDSYNDLWLAAKPGGGYLAGWWGNHHMLASLELDGKMPAPPVVVAQRSGPWPARYVLAGPDRVGVLYLRQPSTQSPVELMFKLVRGDGSDMGPARRVASGVASGDRGTALAWSGKRFAVVYDGKRPDLKLSARLLDQGGLPVGGEVTVPSCLLTARQPEAAWAGDTLGVTFQAGLSGLPTQRACLAALRCR